VTSGCSGFKFRPEYCSWESFKLAVVDSQLRVTASLSGGSGDPLPPSESEAIVMIMEASE
jgi:hypothetical protein